MIDLLCCFGSFGCLVLGGVVFFTVLFLRVFFYGLCAFCCLFGRIGGRLLWSSFINSNFNFIVCFFVTEGFLGPLLDRLCRNIGLALELRGGYRIWRELCRGLVFRFRCCPRSLGFELVGICFVRSCSILSPFLYKKFYINI